MFPLNILKINYLLPQRDDPSTTMKNLSFVDIILFIVLDLIKGSHLNLTILISKMKSFRSLVLTR